MLPDDDQTMLTIDDNVDAAYVLNVQGTGFFRVNYDAANWEALRMTLINDRDAIHKLNRASIVDDAMNLARSDHLPYTTGLEMTRYLTNETEYIPFKSGMMSFEHIETMLRTDEANHAPLRAYLTSLLTDLYEAGDQFVVEDTDSMQDIFFKIELIEWMCLYGYEDCAQTADETFGAWMESGENTIDPDLRQSIYKAAIRQGNQEEFDFLFDQLWVQGVNPNERNKVIYGLGASNDPTLLLELLNESINSG